MIHVHTKRGESQLASLYPAHQKLIPHYHGGVDSRHHGQNGAKEDSFHIEGHTNGRGKKNNLIQRKRVVVLVPNLNVCVNLIEEVPTHNLLVRLSPHQHTIRESELSFSVMLYWYHCRFKLPHVPFTSAIFDAETFLMKKIMNRGIRNSRHPAQTIDILVPGYCWGSDWRQIICKGK